MTRPEYSAVDGARVCFAGVRPSCRLPSVYRPEPIKANLGACQGNSRGQKSQVEFAFHFSGHLSCLRLSVS